MKLLSLITLSVLAVALSSCGVTSNERKPVPPQGSEANYMPWNTPQAGEGSSAFGGALNNQYR